MIILQILFWKLKFDILHLPLPQSHSLSVYCTNPSSVSQNPCPTFTQIHRTCQNGKRESTKIVEHMSGALPMTFCGSSHLILTKPYDKDSINMVILLMRKLNLRENKWLAQDGYKLVSGKVNISIQVNLISKPLCCCSM